MHAEFEAHLEFAREAYLAACRLDVQALKPGNVSLGRPNHEHTAEAFLASAERSADEIGWLPCSLGKLILAMVDATVDAVGTNTNLGIILLAAPLLKASVEGETLPAVLAATTVDDAAQCYAAIRRARPAGMKRATEQDLDQLPTRTLTECMAIAAEWDAVAAAYATDFDLVLGEAGAVWAEALSTRRADGLAGRELAMSRLYVWLASRQADSLIARKHGAAVAEQVRRRFLDVEKALKTCQNRLVLSRVLEELDASLKREKINPGTCADLAVATVLAHDLKEQGLFRGTAQSA